jgi:TM2 domain-containing membrane protein YozV
VGLLGLLSILFSFTLLGTSKIYLGGWRAKLNNPLLILKNKNIYTLDFKRIE